MSLTTGNPAFEAAMAQIEAMGASFAAQLQTVAFDSRHRRIKSLTPADQRITGYGETGFVQMMDSLTSSRHWRQNRAMHLAGARKAQISGHRASAVMQLREAAKCRLSEVRYRNLESVAAPLMQAAE